MFYRLFRSYGNGVLVSLCKAYLLYRGQRVYLYERKGGHNE